MKWIKAISILGVLAMTAALVNGFVVGDFFGEGSMLFDMPWGIVSLVDLYVGFILFSAWIVYRESSLAAKIIWVVLMMVLGFFTASLYTFIVAQRSNGDWEHFFHGSRRIL